MSSSLDTPREIPTATTVAPAAPSETRERFHGPNSSSNLYLVTFLATLFLLLFVSCAIVLRSYVLRRRFQRRLDEAMAAGILLAPRAQGSRKRRFGTKPKFFDAWIAEGGETWDGMMPLSAQQIYAKRRNQDASRQCEPAQEPLTEGLHNGDTTSEGIHFLLRPFRRPWHRSRPIASPCIPPMSLLPEPHVKARAQIMQVSVLIAMPSSNRLRNASTSSLGKGDEEEEIPEVVVGVTRFPYKPDPGPEAY